MSTRAVISFIDADNKVHVYQHDHGAPRGVLAMLRKALTVAWNLPRFEADQFAASYAWAGVQDFLDIMKTHGYEGDVRHFGNGGIRVRSQWRDLADLEWRYEIRHDGTSLVVACYQGNLQTDRFRKVFGGTFDDFATWSQNH
jgi:hypothetical protein